jgi:voltage-gated potassium channel
MREPAVSVRQVVVAVAAFGGLLVVGTAGFMAILGESVVDALYRTVVTVYTAGLVAPPESTGAKLFTLLLIVWGVAIFLYVFGLVIELVVRGTVSGNWAERRMRRRMEQLEGHYIICGYGRVGRQIALEFQDAGVPFVVLDFNPDALEAAREKGVVYLEGNGTEDADLAEAGLERATGLVASSDSDTDNLYITLSARSARPDLLIVARAADTDAASKLRLAGADRVVQPYATAGKEMAKLVLKPQVAAFLDAASATGGPDLHFEEIEVTAASGQASKTIRGIDVRGQTGALIIAIRKRDGSFDATPAPDAVLDEGDVVICVGTRDELIALEELFSPQRAVAR